MRRLMRRRVDIRRRRLLQTNKRSMKRRNSTRKNKRSLNTKLTLKSTSNQLVRPMVTQTLSLVNLRKS